MPSDEPRDHPVHPTRASDPGAPIPRVAVVTGASRGIGRATAARLAADGLVVVAAARSSADLEGLAAGHPGIVAVVADVADEDDVEAVATTAAGHGRLVAWVNNAAILERHAIDELDVETWDRILGVNLRGAFLGCRSALRLMRDHGEGGAIVNVGSLSGMPHVEKFAGLCAYNVSKAGLAALSEAVALEGRPHGVRSVTLAPGAVDTEMLRQANPALRARVGPDGIAAIIAFLLGDSGAPLSGSTLPLFTNG